jgi:Arc/MetJ family transcription regulator
MNLTIDDELFRRAAELTGIRKRADLVRFALESLIALEAGRRLAALGGSAKKLKRPRRRRSGSAA